MRLLTPWHVDHLPAICDTASEDWDAYRLVEAVSLLRAFSLVSTIAPNGVIHVSLHALVHAWARDRQSPHDQQQAWLRMGCLAALAIGYGDLPRDQKHQVQPHVEALVGWPVSRALSTGPPTLVARMLVHCGQYLLDQRSDGKLYALLQALLTSLGLNRLQVEQAWIGLYDFAALASLYHGRVEEAVALLEQVVKIRKQTLAVEHPSRLASQHELAGAYRANGQVREAVALLEEVVEIRKQTLVAEHPDRLASQFYLAVYVWDLGEREASLSLMTHVVNIYKQVQDEQHPARQDSEWWLAHFKQERAVLELG